MEENDMKICLKVKKRLVEHRKRHYEMWKSNN